MAFLKRFDKGNCNCCALIVLKAISLSYRKDSIVISRDSIEGTVTTENLSSRKRREKEDTKGDADVTKRFFYKFDRGNCNW
jgi:hypothetical protein